jgi:hypothetical protein
MFYFVIMGLMSLIILSSCENEYSYMENEEIKPMYYRIEDAKSIVIVGANFLVMEEGVTKNDWEILVQDTMLLEQDKPFELLDTMVRKPLPMMLYDTNNEDFVIAIKGLKYEYTYMNEKMELPCADNLAVKTELVIEKEDKDPFYQYGYIIYTLIANNKIVLATNKQYFIVE